MGTTPQFQAAASPSDLLGLSWHGELGQEKETSTRK